MTGGSQGVKRQLVDELQLTSPEEREELLKNAYIGPTIKEGEGLAMNAELSIPWNRLRHLRR